MPISATNEELLLLLVRKQRLEKLSPDAARRLLFLTAGIGLSVGWLLGIYLAVKGGW